MKGLGETIKALRLEKGLTQPQLAQLVGVSNGMISIWENNINEPKASYLKALANAPATEFGLDFDDTFKISIILFLSYLLQNNMMDIFLICYF